MSMTQEELEKLYGKPISTYTAQQGVDDGLFVAVSKRDLVTRNLFEWTVQHVPDGPKPPDRWPVSMLDWFGSIGTHIETTNKAKAMWVGMIEQDRKIATHTYEHNVGGGIHTLVIDSDPKTGTILGVQLRPTTGRPHGTEHELPNRTVWMIPNEVGGITAMFPEDY